MTLAVARLVQLLENLLGKDLAQLDTPLVEAVNVPDGTLGEGKVLVVGNESTKLGRANVAADEDGCRGAVSKEALVGNKITSRALGLDLLVTLANHQGLSLGKVVGSKHLLVQVVGDGVV